MAPLIFFAIISSVVFRASLSLPISVQSLEKLQEIELTESASEVMSKLGDAIELVKSLSTVTLGNDLPSFGEEYDIKRTKRHIAKTPVRCPEDRIEYGGQCLTADQMAEYNEDDGPVDYKDYEAER